MAFLKKYAPFFTSALLMCILLIIIYPHYQYYIDPDGTAYLTISQRYANGDYAKAINGYWSPWSCWLTVMFIKTGFAAIPASVIVNTLGATGCIFISQSLFLKFSIVRKMQWLLCITIAFFLCYAIFWQSFNDIWECFFLLSALMVMLSDQFIYKPFLWLLCGVIGALAYFAKAYSFPFFILNTFCCIYFISKGNTRLWLKIAAIAVGTMMLCSLPWLYLLHDKYGVWTTATAGPLNLSWYLVGHPYWKDGIDLLIPPAYHDSPYYWEDPYFANGVTPHFWDSFSLLGLQILRVGYNVYKFLISALQLSVFFPLIVVIAFFSFRSMKVKSLFTEQEKIVMLSFLIFPLGYLLINFEPRYLWYMVPIAMVIGCLWIQRRVVKGQNLLFVIFPLTFLIYPAWCMSKMYDEGLMEYRIARQLEKKNVHGSFTSVVSQGKDVQRMERLAYFSGNQYYSFARKQFHKSDVSEEMKKYHINYYFTFHPATDTLITNGIYAGDRKDSVSGLTFSLINP